MEAFPFTSQKNPDGSYDRASTSAVLRRVFLRIFSTGISRDTSSDLMVTANSGMSVTVKGGGGIIRGVIFNEPYETNLAIPAASTLYPRIDNIVLRLSDESRDVKMIVIEGTPATAPKAPQLIRNTVTYDLCVAQVYVGKGVTTITGSNITDTRLNTDLCGLMSPNPYPADTTAYYNQIQSSLADNTAKWTTDFNAWFTELQNVLDENTAGNLYNMITAIPRILIQEGDEVPPVVEGAILIRR